MPRRVLVYLIAAGVFALDRASKLAVQRLLPLWDSREAIPGFFNIVHSENSGAAFSLFMGMPGGWRRFLLIGSSAGAAALLTVLLWRGKASRLQRAGLALILGGALGNLWDRAIPGAVTDFLDLYVGSYHWPAFNVADSAITIGACLVVLDVLLGRRAGAPHSGRGAA